MATRRHISRYLISGWTLKGAIQSHIDIYTSQATLLEVKRAFPYLVSKEFASGGGDVRINSLCHDGTSANFGQQVPDFQWHVIEDRVPFEIKDTGIKVTPFPG